MTTCPEVRSTPAGVLFDLDGTLVDTAPDLVAALNLALAEHSYSSVLLEQVRHAASHGSMALVRAAQPHLDESFALALQQTLLRHYEIINGQHCRLFEGIPALLDALTSAGIPFGIVTNKAARFARPLIERLAMSNVSSLISGDSSIRSKPDSAPMLLAASQLNCDPADIFYLGDAKRDMDAAKASGMTAVLANWGYFGLNDNPDAWPYDLRLACPLELLNYLSHDLWCNSEG
ncbi:HAD family hydrolase [Shewanella sp.]|uniref:HAD family hydrolase n=1 Tax=Shewanella sp. TaxID=50422 RepID=UPI003567FD4F